MRDDDISDRVYSLQEKEEEEENEKEVDERVEQRLIAFLSK